MSGFDWAGMQRAGLTGLGLTPDQFWALTPAELLMMLGEGQGPAPMGRSALEALVARFPDDMPRQGGPRDDRDK